MAHHNVPIGERVVRWAVEAAIKPGLLNLPLPFIIPPRAGPARLVYLRCGGVTGLPTNSGESISKGMVSAEHITSDKASKSVKAVGVQRLPALPGALRPLRHFVPATGALVPAARVCPLLAPEAEWDPQPQAGRDLELDVREPGHPRGGCR